jgi:AraC-like DNA-binding protein
MDGKCENMDQTCVLAERLLAWIQHSPTMPVLYTGTATLYRTAPAPYLEIAYIQKGQIPRLHLGERITSFPNQHVGIHNVHFGAHSGDGPPFFGWCVYLDMRAEESLADLAQTPLFHSIRVDQPQRMLEAFQRLIAWCRHSDWSSPGYPPSASFLAHRAEHLPMPGDDALMRGALLEILGLLLNEARPHDAPQIPQSVQDAIRFIEVRYADPSLTLDDIASAVLLSPDHFGRLFRRHTGQTPMATLQRIRTHNAAYLLHNTSYRIDTIAREVGFTDPFHFSRIFKKHEGLSPRAYRGEH